MTHARHEHGPNGDESIGGGVEWTFEIGREGLDYEWPPV
jgi:hypothetical protein